MEREVFWEGKGGPKDLFGFAWHGKRPGRVAAESEDRSVEDLRKEPGEVGRQSTATRIAADPDTLGIDFQLLDQLVRRVESQAHAVPLGAPIAGAMSGDENDLALFEQIADPSEPEIAAIGRAQPDQHRGRFVGFVRGFRHVNEESLVFEPVLASFGVEHPEALPIALVAAADLVDAALRTPLVEGHRAVLRRAIAFG